MVKHMLMIKAFFRIIRWPNLLLIVLSMYLMYVPVIQNLLGSEAAIAGIQLLDFVLLVLATIFIAAGGYIINDIVDIEADKINKPGKNTVGTVFSVQQAKILYYVITLLGITAGSIVSFRVNAPGFALFFVFTAGLMWFYAKDYQCRPLMGNIIIGILSALSFGLIYIVDLLAIKNYPYQVFIQSADFYLVTILTLIYMGFALLTTVIREIVKDIEDISGDTEVGCTTYAVKFGLKKAANLAMIISFVGLTASFFIQWVFYSYGLTLLFFYFFLIDLLFGILLFRLSQAQSKEDYSSLSIWIKLLMLTGVLSMILFYFGG